MKKIERIAALEQRVAALEAALEAKIGVAEHEHQKKAKPELAVGQVWKMRNGQKVRITSENTGCFRSERPWFGEIEDGAEGLFRNGVMQGYTDKDVAYDLVELISDTPVQAQKSEGQANAGTHNVLPKPYVTPPLRSYWFPNLLTGCAEERIWDHDDYQDDELLESGLVFREEQDAEIVLKAIMSFLKENTKGVE